MKIKNWMKRDKITRVKYLQNEINKLVLKSLLANMYFDKNAKIYWSNLYNKYGKHNSIAYYRHGCNLTGSGRSVFKQFKSSRHIIKKYAAMGQLPGVRKSSF